MGLVCFQEDWVEMHAGISSGLSAGWLKPVVCKEYKMAESSEAHEDVITNSGSLGKRVIVLS